MSNLKVPARLDEAELKLLDDFLLKRLDDETADRVDETDEEEGITDVSELDGFFTAIVSGPNLIMPSRWLPAVWGDYEPVWESQKQFETIFSLMMRHQNSIVEMFMSRAGNFQPLFHKRTAKGRTHVIADEWCHGYLRGIALDVAAWRAAGEEIGGLLWPIKLFGSEQGWEELKGISEAERDAARAAIPACAVGLYTHWLLRRQKQTVQRAEPARRTEPKIGRNDLCPCGSGKKYKHCCLH